MDWIYFAQTISVLQKSILVCINNINDKFHEVRIWNNICMITKFSYNIFFRVLILTSATESNILIFIQTIWWIFIYDIIYCPSVVETWTVLHYFNWSIMKMLRTIFIIKFPTPFHAWKNWTCNCDSSISLGLISLQKIGCQSLESSNKSVGQVI